MQRHTMLAALTGAAVSLTLAGATIGATIGAATAVPASVAPRPATVAKGLFTPLSVAVGGDGAVYYSENFKGTLAKRFQGRTRTLFESGGAEVGAVSVVGRTVTFALTKSNGQTMLKRKVGTRPVASVARLDTFEKSRNPDRRVAYGIPGLGAACAAQFPEHVPASYTGIVESHPYATLTVGRTTYVADAAANAIFAVTRGKVRTLAVLPPVPLKITAARARAAGLPSCAVGRTYRFEAVPTDVEVGPDGKLYVTGLPGGPEDPSLGSRGVVFRIDPSTRKVARVASGLLSPVGVAVSPRGDLYVSELFGGRIAKVAKDTRTPKTYRRVNLPGDVEWTNRGIYATTDVLTGLSGQPGDVPSGKVVRFN